MVILVFGESVSYKARPPKLVSRYQVIQSGIHKRLEFKTLFLTPNEGIPSQTEKKPRSLKEKKLNLFSLVKVQEDSIF